jgi:hypothetical protein
MITTTHDAHGAIIGVTIDGTAHSEAALLTLLSRYARAEAEREALRAEVARLRTALGLHNLELDDDDRAAVARLSE